MFRLALLLFALPLPVLADAPNVETARAIRTGDTWHFDVTIAHPDTGWDHYADAWRILDPDGRELGLRVLLHPHVTEQPFTRSLTGVTIPAGLTHVLIQSRCLTDGWSDHMVPVQLK